MDSVIALCTDAIVLASVLGVRLYQSRGLRNHQVFEQTEEVLS